MAHSFRKAHFPGGGINLKNSPPKRGREILKKGGGRILKNYPLKRGTCLEKSQQAKKIEKGAREGCCDSGSRHTSGSDGLSA
jgi:hypothetical protein